jgi:hypothetical protein
MRNGSIRQDENGMGPEENGSSDSLMSGGRCVQAQPSMDNGGRGRNKKEKQKIRGQSGS